MEALARLRRRDRKQFFAFAVDEKLVPDYRLVVSTPMSLDVMAKKVQEGAYKSTKGRGQERAAPPCSRPERGGEEWFKWVVECLPVLRLSDSASASRFRGL